MPGRKRFSRGSMKNWQPRIPLAEQLLIGALSEIPGPRVLCTTVGRGHLAWAAAAAGRQVRCCVLDQFVAELIRLEGEPVASTAPTDDRAGKSKRPRSERKALAHAWQEEDETGPVRPTARDVQAAGGALEIVCEADLGGQDYDAVLMPVDTRLETELTRELLQEACFVLREGGRFLSAVGKPDDHWLNDELRKLYPKVTRLPSDTGVLYMATRGELPRKRKQFDAEYAFRDEGRLIYGKTRPGVFSHRSLDGGARALLKAMTVRPTDRVIDMGCGSGAVALAAALRAPQGSVLAIDAQARAIQCTQWGAERNEITNLQTLLCADGQLPDPGTFDLLAGNPPYFSDYRIAELFLQTALRSLKSGGCVWMVTKTPTWFEERMPQLFADVESVPVGSYHVISGHKG